MCSKCGQPDCLGIEPTFEVTQAEKITLMKLGILLENGMGTSIPPEAKKSLMFVTKIIEGVIAGKAPFVTIEKEDKAFELYQEFISQDEVIQDLPSSPNQPILH